MPRLQASTIIYPNALVVLIVRLLHSAASIGHTDPQPQGEAAVTFGEQADGSLVLANGVVRAVWRHETQQSRFEVMTSSCQSVRVGNDRCLSTASLDRGTPITAPTCDEDATRWCVEQDVQLGWLKVRACGGQPGSAGQGLCLQLHNGNVSAGNLFWLWNCSVGLDGTMDFQHGNDKRMHLKENPDYCAAISSSATIVLARCTSGIDPLQEWILPPPEPPPPVPAPPPTPDPPPPTPPPLKPGTYPMQPGWTLSWEVWASVCDKCAEKAWIAVAESDNLIHLLVRDDSGGGAIPWDYGLSNTTGSQKHEWTDRFGVAPPSKTPHGPHILLLGNPARASRPNVTTLNQSGGITVTWTVYLSAPRTTTTVWSSLDGALDTSQFAADATFTLLPGADAINERVVVRRLRRSALGSFEAFRIRRPFHTDDVPVAQQGSFFSAFHTMGWQQSPTAAFLVVATSPTADWSPRAGSDKMFQTAPCGPACRSSSGSGKLPVSDEYTIWHQAPPCDDTRGWIEYEDVPVGATYTIDHAVLMSQEYIFSRAIIARVRQMQPVETIPMRYSWRYMLDKMMFTLRNTTAGWREYTNASMTNGKPESFGFYAKNWYSIAQSPGGRVPPMYEDIEHSPDWGASFDAWTAVFLKLYAQQWGDKDGWVSRRLPLLVRGLTLEGWQKHTMPSLQGAFWQCWAPWDSKGVPGSNGGFPGFHMAHFIQNLNHVWVCDSGKIGSFYLRLARLIDSENSTSHQNRARPEGQTIDSNLLVLKAIAAGDFLLRMQRSDDNVGNSSFYSVDAVPGDLTGSVYSTETGNVTHASNFAGTVCAVLLWAELYTTTGNTTWLHAAERATRAIRTQWMQPGAYMFCGGELDDLFNPKGSCSDIGTTSVMYGTMAFASLALATESDLDQIALHRVALNCTRTLADYMLAQQEVRDVNYGYYRVKARWMGADFKTSGAYQEWIRPETTYFMWRAYQATREPEYLSSMLRHATWMQYKQWDEFDLGSMNAMRTFGGSDESFQVGSDNLNGFGANFWSETVGQGIALLEYVAALDAGQIVPRD